MGRLLLKAGLLDSTWVYRMGRGQLLFGREHSLHAWTGRDIEEVNFQ